MRIFQHPIWSRCRDGARGAYETLSEQVVKWNEFYLAVLLVLLWPLVQFGIKVLDPTAYPFDAGVLHADYYAALKFALFYGFVWVGIKLNQPVIFEFFEGSDKTQAGFNDTFKALDPWQKLKAALAIWALHLFFAAVCLLAARP